MDFIFVQACFLIGLIKNFSIAHRLPAMVRRAIIDKDVKIPESAIVGVDHEFDRVRGFTVTESGIVVIGKSDSVEPGVPKSHSNFPIPNATKPA